MAIVLVTSAGAAGAATATTASVNASGVTLVVGFVTGRGTATMTDTLGSSFNGLTNQVNDAFGRFFWVIPSSPGAGYQVTGGTSGGTRCAVSWLGFSGTHASSPFDTQNGTMLFASPGQPGSVTPSEANCVVVTAIGGYFQFFDGAGASTVDSPFTRDGTSAVAGASGVNFSSEMAYDIQTTATARNPTWTGTSMADTPAVIAVFKSSGGGGAVVIPPTPLFLNQAVNRAGTY